MIMKLEDVSGPFTRIEWQRINLNSDAQIKEYLLKHGWQPDEWNYKQENGRDVYDENGDKIKSSPKLTESSYHTVEGDIPKLIARRNILIHRQRMIKNTTKRGEEKGWLNIVRDDGRIGASAIPNSTNTGRMAHRNVVNVPKAIDAVVYGKELRELFIVPEGYVLVGCDAAALEARMQAHYIYNYQGGPELADILLNGDIHQMNADLWGTSRNDAKSPYYCLMYGGQPQKFATTMGCSLKDAKRHYDAFWKQYVPLAMLKEDLTKAWKARGGNKGGYLRGIDGRKLFARSPHSLVNMMFQSAGSITVKVATLYLNKWIKQRDLDAHQVLHFHDEFQIECKEVHADEVVELSKKAFTEAGKYLKMNVEIVGEPKVGLNWKETH